MLLNVFKGGRGRERGAAARTRNLHFGHSLVQTAGYREEVDDSVSCVLAAYFLYFSNALTFELLTRGSDGGDIQGSIRLVARTKI